MKPSHTNLAMYIEQATNKASWIDLILFVGLVALYLTFRVLIHKRMSKKHQTVGLVDDWFGFLWSEQNERSDSTLVKFGSRLPLTTGLMMLFTCLMSSPNELYRVGVQLIYLLVSYVIASVIVVELFLPVLNKHKIFSVNQYLDARFGRSVRILSALIHLFHLYIQSSLALCVLSLTFSQVSGYRIWMSVLVTGFLVVAYTGLGGLRIGPILNLLQVAILFASLSAVTGIGIQHAGGITRLVRQTMQTGLWNFHNFQFNPLEDYTCLTVLIGGIGTMVSMLSVTPTQMELFAISKTPAILRLRSYLSTFICLLFMFVLMVCGLVCLSTLAGCDVKLARLIKHRDQLFPFTLVVLFDEVIGIRGLLFGLFVACALNTITTTLNSLATVVVRDIFSRSVLYGSKNSFHRTMDRQSRLTAVAFALLAIPLAFGFCHSPVSLFKLSLTTAAVCGGPVFAVLFLGLLVPCVNSMGASACLLASCLLGAVMSVLTIHFGSAQSNVLQHTSVENCIQFASDLKIGLEMPKNQSLENTLSGPLIFTLSYIYFAGLFITFGLLIALVVSVLPGFNSRRPVDIRLLLIRKGGSSEVVMTVLERFKNITDIPADSYPDSLGYSDDALTNSTLLWR